jgi:hypothetical protein
MADNPHPTILTFAIATADVTGSASEAMAYAAEEALPAEPGPAPIAAAPADEPSAASGASMQRHVFAHMMSGAQRLDSPWIRAAMLTPNVSENLIITRFSSPDPRGLHELFHKPTKALAMGFSEDPAGGMRSDRFTGEAIVFLATATFVRAQTASLN